MISDTKNTESHLLVPQASLVRISHQPERWQSAQTGVCEKQPGQTLKWRALQPKHGISGVICPCFSLFTFHRYIFRKEIFDKWPVCFGFCPKTRTVGTMSAYWNWSPCPVKEKLWRTLFCMMGEGSASLWLAKLAILRKIVQSVWVIITMRRLSFLFHTSLFLMLSQLLGLHVTLRQSLLVGNVVKIGDTA